MSIFVDFDGFCKKISFCQVDSFGKKMPIFCQFEKRFFVELDIILKKKLFLVRAGKWCLSKAAYEYYYCQKLNLSEIQKLPTAKKEQNEPQV